MTVDQRLIQLLERATPEPPKALDVDDIAQRVRRPRRTWAPLLAAACVLLLAVGVVVVTRHDDHSATTARTTAWRYTKLSGDYPPQYAPQLFGDGKSVYAFQYLPVGRSAIDRLSPTNGAVAARVQFEGLEIPSTPALTETYVVAPMFGRGGASLILLTRTQLEVRARLPAVTARNGRHVLVAAQGNTAYLAVGRQITEYDLKSRTITSRFTVGQGQVSALDLFRAATYVGTTRGDVIIGPATKVGLQPGHVGGQIGAVIATSGGLWVETKRAGRNVVVTFDGRVVAGYESITESGGTMWLASDTELACADPNTGRIRASSVQPHDLVLAGIVTTPDRVVAEASARHAPDNYLVELHPPHECGV